MRDNDPNGHIRVYRGTDASAFIDALFNLFQSPPPPPVQSAESVGVYESSYTDSVAMRFFDEFGCDLGIQGQMPQSSLQQIIAHIGLSI